MNMIPRRSRGLSRVKPRRTSFTPTLPLQQKTGALNGSRFSIAYRIPTPAS
jgi:hypothetical protein